MNHKRRRPKNRRAGCLMCKPNKMNGAKGQERATKIKGVRPRVRIDKPDWFRDAEFMELDIDNLLKCGL